MNTPVVIAQTPNPGDDFTNALPLYLQAGQHARLLAAVAKLPILTPVSTFVKADGNAASDFCVAYNHGGKLYVKDVIVPYFFTGVTDVGSPVFLVNGRATGNPTVANPTAFKLQYVGIALSHSQMLLDIKAPYDRLF